MECVTAVLINTTTYSKSRVFSLKFSAVIALLICLTSVLVLIYLYLLPTPDRTIIMIIFIQYRCIGAVVVIAVFCFVFVFVCLYFFFHRKRCDGCSYPLLRNGVTTCIVLFSGPGYLYIKPVKNRTGPKRTGAVLLVWPHPTLTLGGYSSPYSTLYKDALPSSPRK